MPERPDLEYVIPILARNLKGARIAGVIVKKPPVLRLALQGTVADALVGRDIKAVERRLHFVMFTLAGPDPAVELVIHPMLAGKFTISAADERTPGDTAMVFALADGRELRYRDSEQMGKVYVLPKGRWELVPGLGTVGLDIMDPKVFTKAAFKALAKRRKDQLKVFLMDKAALDSLGNAYADETCFAARLHPKTRVRELSDEELDGVHDALVEVLTAATAEVKRRGGPIDEKVRDFLKVRNRHGEPCPRCGDRIRRAGVHGHDAFFCPTCQPETRQHAVVDWRKASAVVRSEPTAAESPAAAASKPAAQKRKRR